MEFKNDEMFKKWLTEFKEGVREQFKPKNEEQLNEMVLDAMFYGFQQGELRRTDLAKAAKILGYEVSEEFMNDPHPDPIDVKGDK